MNKQVFFCGDINAMKTALVVMPFRDDFFIHYLAIQEELATLDYYVYRLDEVQVGSCEPHVQLAREIKNSDIVVALCLDNNAHVFFEIGVAHILKKPLIVFYDKSSVLTDFFNFLHSVAIDLDSMSISKAVLMAVKELDDAGMRYPAEVAASGSGS